MLLWLACRRHAKKDDGGKDQERENKGEERRKKHREREVKREEERSKEREKNKEREVVVLDLFPHSFFLSPSWGIEVGR